MADNGDLVVPSLLKMAYNACDRDERGWYDDSDNIVVTPVDLRICCTSVLKIIETNTVTAGLWQPLGPRTSMYSKVRKTFDFDPSTIVYNICEKAAENGHMDCLKLAHAMGVSWYKSYYIWEKIACDLAARNGHLECLEFCLQNGCSFSADVLNEAAQSGHLDCVKYCLENGCPWDEHTCSMAAMSGNLDVLRYCRERGCPWDRVTGRLVLSTGRLDCLRYVVENGYDPAGLVFVGKNTDPACARYIAEHLAAKKKLLTVALFSNIK